MCITREEKIRFIAKRDMDNASLNDLKITYYDARINYISTWSDIALDINLIERDEIEEVQN